MIIILAVLAGCLAGIFFVPESFLAQTGLIMDVGLCLLLLLVGIDIGKQKGILKEVKNLGKSLILIPLLIALGSVIGGIASGYLFGMPMNEGSAIGAGLGWYSLSAVLLSDYSNELSALAFLSNVTRELFAIMLIPFIAKYIGYAEAVAPSGATAMDTTLPIITRYTDAKTSVLAFVSGVFLSTLVPVLVPFLIGLH
jgi:uncharacterized membrane protein YbjE (DUF340 family)